MPVFKYDPLQSDASVPQIRLLDLLPGQGAISCRLRHVSLTVDQKYEALSYCWGKSTNMISIKLNDMEFPITANLHSALRRLRSQTQLRTLWVDAICINQDDNHEKNSQVPLMRNIYETCQRVQIWLGEQDRYTKLAYSFLELLAPWGQERAAAGIEERRWMELDRRIYAHGLNDAERRHLWRAAYSLFDRPWFQRVWVIQELAVCPEAVMICGKHKIGWDKVEKAQYISDRMFTEGLDRLITERDNWRKQHFEDLAHLVIKHIGALASNPRDKIYALTGIAGSSENYNVEIDYTVEVERVFKTITTSWLSGRSDLDILCFSRGCRDNSFTTTPSWVLDWNYSTARDPIAVFSFAWGPSLMEDGTVFQATGDSTSEIRFVENGQVLGISGSILDTVTNVGLVMTNTQDKLPGFTWAYWCGLVEDFMCFSNWRDICLVDDAQQHRLYQPTGQTARDAFWQTCSALVPDLDANLDQIRDEFTHLDNYIKTFRRLGTIRKRHIRPLYHLLLLGKLLKQAILRDQTLLAWSARTSAATNRRLIRTKNGYIGLAPRLVHEGDSIALMKGSKVPLAIRPSGPRWKLVGECYIHGIMHGEAFDKQKCQVLWLE